LIAASSDLALVIGERGDILDVSFNSEELADDLDVRSPWLNRPWIDTVSADSRAKVEMLLREATSTAAPRTRHVNHPSRHGGSVPILYSAVPVGAKGRLVAFGRDLRAVSELQQRLVDAQQSMEQDYSRLRDVEMRYRLLFQTSSEAVLILDAANARVIETNPAAQRLFGDSGLRALKTGMAHAFDAASEEVVQALLNTAGAMGRAEPVRACIKGTSAEFIVSALVFREGAAARFLVRVTPPAAGAAVANETTYATAQLAELVKRSPDGFVVVDSDGVIVAANAAFLTIAQVTHEEQARNENLDRWFGRQGVDLAVLIANLRQRGAVRLFATIVRGESGSVTPVEVSAVALMNNGHACFGLAVRDIGRRLAAVSETPAVRSEEHLAELIGRVSLKEMVRQSTDVIERLCIETALKLTGDNRASAAEMLGVSRQSFYVKLRRYGLGELAPNDGDIGGTNR
jgi:transcriptional regulator PpsR